jgi:hypothetical protein
MIFPDYKEKYVLNWGLFIGSGNNDDDLLKFQARVENRLVYRAKCAVSIYYRNHTISGCFDTTVVYHDYAYFNNAFYFTSVCGDTGDNFIFCFC